MTKGIAEFYRSHLLARSIEPHVIEYLKTPPTAAELKAIVGKLGIKPKQLVRMGEEI